MRIFVDSAADFTPEELARHDVSCVPMQVVFGGTALRADALAPADFWQRLLAGEICKTSQPSPDAFHAAFRAALDAGEEVVYIGVSSALSGTMQSATIAASMLESDGVHLVDSQIASGGQKLLALHACKLRDAGRLSARAVAEELAALSRRLHIYASLDTLENLARSGRISRVAANIGSLAQLKPLVRLTPQTHGCIEVCGKSIGRHRATDAVARLIGAHRIDARFPVIPLYTYCADNCAAMLKKLRTLGISADEDMLCALGPTLGAHIGPNAYGLVFVEAE